MDHIVAEQEALALRAFASGVMANFSAGGAGGPTILDLHSGALSHESHFINLFPLLTRRGLALDDFPGMQVYRCVACASAARRTALVPRAWGLWAELFMPR
jgi:hypothetical protein